MSKSHLRVCNRVMGDALLIWRCRQGSRDALRQVYERYHVDPPSILVENVVHSESFPDDLFEFQIPAGATVVEK